ncbi:MAG: UDP-N-acetylmuramoyl-tripeptide--D-alanyl-D-alanine ligase [Actinomycetia bacterium]|nr:UDP-N-acetylmuramoyl-tripeptide--D-alanyl-D-alanine ligase [Actinomycetes bacterium]
MTPVFLGWSLVDIADAVSGELVGESSDLLETVATDSRRALDGALFVALNGETFDGHSFAAQALEAGAVAIMVERRAGITAIPRIEVASTRDALARLAVKRRDELSIPVVAITGSTGKTSTKDLLSAGLEGSWASPRSFNNEIGVPLTVLSTPSDASVLVVEVGSRGRGHIKWLAPMIRPDISVITNLGVVHLETFGSLDGLADAKYELVEALPVGGVAVLPYGEESLTRKGPYRTITFGATGADVQVSDISLDDLGRPSFLIQTDQSQHQVMLSLSGKHHGTNAAAAIAVACALGVDLEAFIHRLGEATASAWRMEIHQGSYTVVNDAYNANPQSVESALQTIATMPGRHIAVLGVMAELGQVCEQEHLRLGELARELGFAELVVVGSDHGYAAGFGIGACKVTDIEEAADTLASIVQPGDVVLVKASRSASLERLALRLIEDAAS